MQVEARLDKLEALHRNTDAEVHGLARVCADIKNIALTNQHDISGLRTDISGLKTDVDGLKTDIAGIKACISALAEATHAGFRRADEQHNDLVKEVRENQQENRERFDRQEHHQAQNLERFDQLELLIRQLILNSKN